MQGFNFVCTPGELRKFISGSFQPLGDAGQVLWCLPFAVRTGTEK